MVMQKTKILIFTKIAMDFLYLGSRLARLSNVTCTPSRIARLAPKNANQMTIYFAMGSVHAVVMKKRYRTVTDTPTSNRIPTKKRTANAFEKLVKIESNLFIKRINLCLRILSDTLSFGVSPRKPQVSSLRSSRFQRENNGILEFWNIGLK
jgi:hypothetical protein